MPKFAQGKFNLKFPEKYIGKGSPIYRSSWEFAFMRFCDEHRAIQQWASEPIKIPYRNPLNGKQTIYVPDFFIVYADAKGRRRVEVIEVKPENQTVKEKLGRSKYNQASWVKNQAKWEAAAKWCKQRGIFFRIVNEGDIFHQGKRR